MELLQTPARRLLAKFEGYQAAADALSEAAGEDVPKQYIQYWVNNDFIPPHYWRAVSSLLGITIDELLDHAEERARRTKERKGNLNRRSQDRR